MPGAKTCLWFLLFLQAVSCATVTHAETGVLAFRAQGMTGFGRDLVLAWSEDGQLQAFSLDGKARGQCRLALQQLDQLIVSGSEIYVAGGVDGSTRAVLRTNTSCHTLDRWSLPDGWAEIATDERGMVIVTADGTAVLQSGGLFGPMQAHVRRGPERRPAPSALYWLSFDRTSVLCRRRDLSMRGSSPGWCALQRPDGWVATGEWDVAVACGGHVLVRSGMGPKRVRWESVRLDSGTQTGSVVLPRGAYRCADEQFIVAADGTLKSLDPSTLKAKSTVKVTPPVEQIEVLANQWVYTTNEGARIRFVAHKD